MSAGRCAGCGYTNSSCKTVRNHVLSCAEYAQLYRVSPEKCLDPTDEYVRFKQEEGSEEARLEAKDVRLKARFAELDRRRDQQAQRWKPKDLLDD